MNRKCLILLLSLVATHGVFANTNSSKSLDKSDPLSIKPLLKDLLMQNQQTLNHLMSEVQALQKTRQKHAPTTPQKVNKANSPMDREAMNSPIFLPGGAPIPEGYNDRYKDQQKQQQPSTQDNKDKSADDAAKAKNQNNDSASTSSSDYNNPYSNYNNSSGGYYPSNSTTNPLLQFSPQQDKYTYTIANTSNTDGISPFNEASSSNSIKISFNLSTYNRISFCTSSSFSDCSQTFSLPVTITDKSTITNISYTPQAVSGQPSGSKYYIANLYVQLTNTNNANSKRTSTISFPINCTVQSDANANLSCTVTSTMSVSV
ncbi:hypothetical protein [Cysteiniphilum sp. 6C5]|uniref:hypothetical protein n=1 Tax=unclassified Cysteiniphilum TaxID=2610889 RepID=UPI003F84F53E